jgi:peptidyl-prolyl cis-trans isomerase NIMA-interacting 1
MKPASSNHFAPCATPCSRLVPVALLLLAGLLAACGSGPPPATAENAPAADKAAAPAEPSASADPAVDAEAADKCLAAAGAKRARYSGEPPKVGVKHVLVKFKGAKNADDKITRSREAACLRAIEARDKIREGADWDEVVKQYSDEAGAATRGGSVGTVERQELAKPFADAAFELGVNQLSDVVETESGIHIIFRTE